MDNLLSLASSRSLSLSFSPDVIWLSFYFSFISNAVALSRPCPPTRRHIYSSRSRSLLRFISRCNLISTSLSPACRPINSHGNSSSPLSFSRAVLQYYSFPGRISRRQRALATCPDILGLNFNDMLFANSVRSILLRICRAILFDERLITSILKSARRRVGL